MTVCVTTSTQRRAVLVHEHQRHAMRVVVGQNEDLVEGAGWRMELAGANATQTRRSSPHSRADLSGPCSPTRYLCSLTRCLLRGGLWGAASTHGLHTGATRAGATANLFRGRSTGKSSASVARRSAAREA